MDNDLCMQNEIDAEIDMTMNEAMNDCADWNQIIYLFSFFVILLID